MNKKELQEKFEKFKRTTGKVISGAVIIAFALAIVLFSMPFYTVGEQEKAVVTRFGKYVTTNSAGAHFKIPFIDSVSKVSTTTKGMNFGYNTTPDGENISNNDSEMITNDYNFLRVDFFIEYRVSDPYKYIFATTEPVEILKDVMEAEVRRAVSQFTVDEILTTGKASVQSLVRDNVVSQINDYDIGLQVTNVIIQDTEPPTDEIIQAFKAVENARQNKETKINEANRYYSEKIPGARAEADKIVKQAEANKQAHINDANAQVARFNELYKEYVNNPEIVKTRLYLERMEAIMPSLSIIINGSDNNDILKILPLETGKTTTTSEGGSVNE